MGRCEDIRVVDLRKMASDAKIPNRSKLNKAELCIALGLRKNVAVNPKKNKVAPQTIFDCMKPPSKGGMNVKELKELAVNMNISSVNKLTRKEVCDKIIETVTKTQSVSKQKPKIKSKVKNSSAKPASKNFIRKKGEFARAFKAGDDLSQAKFGDMIYEPDSYRGLNSVYIGLNGSIVSADDDIDTYNAVPTAISDRIENPPQFFSKIVTADFSGHPEYELYEGVGGIVINTSVHGLPPSEKDFTHKNTWIWDVADPPKESNWFN